MKRVSDLLICQGGQSLRLTCVLNCLHSFASPQPQVVSSPCSALSAAKEQVVCQRLKNEGEIRIALPMRYSLIF